MSGMLSIDTIFGKKTQENMYENKITRKTNLEDGEFFGQKKVLP